MRYTAYYKSLKDFRLLLQTAEECINTQPEGSFGSLSRSLALDVTDIRIEGSHKRLSEVIYHDREFHVANFDIPETESATTYQTIALQSWLTFSYVQKFKRNVYYWKPLPHKKLNSANDVNFIFIGLWYFLSTVLVNYDIKGMVSE